MLRFGLSGVYVPLRGGLESGTKGFCEEAKAIVACVVRALL